MAPTTQSGPEIPFGPEFGDAVRAARKRDGYSQGALAQLVGVSQAVISDIERGEAVSSSHVVAICRVLNLPLPIVATDSIDRRWIEAGRALRARRPAHFARHLALVEGEIHEMDGSPAPPESHSH